MTTILGAYEVVTHGVLDRARVTHGFTTHRGTAGADLARGGDFHSLARAAGFADVRTLAQRHGTEVVRAEEVDSRAPADALITDLAGLLLGVQSADCVPILLYDPRHRAVGAIHAGWRGTAARIASTAVEAMGASYDSRPEDLWAVIGPAIGPCCYEVGPEVQEAIERVAPGAGMAIGTGPSGRPSVNLWRANRILLDDAGIRSDHILLVNLCTRCHADLFPSHRRDGPGCGRLLGFIGLPVP
jgi:YfiH family protein